MRCFLRALAYWGFGPKVVVTDGSNLYPAVLAEVWPAARHQLCVFHVLQDVTNKVLDAVRRLRRAAARRGNAGRKRRRGRPSEKQKRRARRRGPTNKEKAAFVYKHRFLIVKRTENLTGKDWDDLGQMFRYLPGLRPLWYFCRDVYRLFSAEQVIRLARRRRTLLLKEASYREVPELVKAMGLLEGEKFDKMVAFLECPGPAGQRVRTNNHVERSNRKLRFDEKVRYKFRTEGSLDRFLRLRLGLLGQPAAALQAPVKAEPGGASAPKQGSRPSGNERAGAAVSV
jgi:transposase-like protein